MLAQRRRFEMALQSAALFSFRPVIDAAQSCAAFAHNLAYGHIKAKRQSALLFTIITA